MNIYIEQDNASYRWDIGQSKPTADQQNKDIVFLTGGEPFFKNKLPYYLKQYPEAKFVVETNATTIDLKCLDDRDIELHLKVDGIGMVQEYLRPGCTWSTIETNIELLTKSNIKFKLIPKLTVFNIIHIADLANWCNERGYEIAEPESITYPGELAPYNLPHQLHDKVPADYQKYLKNNSTIDCLNFINDIDHKWRQNIVDYLPEWKIVFDQLHWSSFEQLKVMDKEIKKYVG